MTDEWKDCYEEGWKGLITSESFSHPAKFSRSLIKKIYNHAIENGWIDKGGKVLDPFGGVALGALEAMRHGFNWVGVELEQKFVDLGKKNIKKWEKTLTGVNVEKGQAHLVQGDSRRLKSLVGAVDIVVSSPPYAECGAANQGNQQRKFNDKSYDWRGKGRDGDTYGDSPGQLGKLPEGDLDLVISSPPYAEQDVNVFATKNQGKRFDQLTEEEKQERKDGAMGRHGFRNLANATPGQLGAMKEGEVDLVISSPPYSERHAYKDDRTVDAVKKLKASPGSKIGGVHIHDNAGQTEGNLGQMTEGQFDIVVSSPPYTETHGRQKNLQANWCERGGDRFLHSQDYAKTEGNLANMKEGEVDLVISSPPYAEGIGHDPGPNANKEEHPERYLAQEKYTTAFKSDGNLGKMKDNGYDLVVSSPPFMAALDGGGINKKGYGDGSDKVGERTYNKEMTGNSPGQLGAMSEGDLDLVVSSPPYEDSIKGEHEEKETAKESWDKRTDRSQGGPLGQSQRFGGYGTLEGQLGATSGDTFWQASQEIVKQCYDLLKPGGHAIWVTKDYVKNKQRVPFSDRWQKLCESVGFRLVCRHHALLVKVHGEQLDIYGESKKITTERKSFFRRLQESKGSPKIDWEDVICMEKL